LFSLLCVSALCGSAGFSAEVTKSYDIPAGPAEQTLKTFSAQSGQEVLFATKTTGKVQTNAVRGEHTAAAAIERLLDGTGLKATREAKTGAFTVMPDPNAARAAQLESVRPEKITKTDSGAIELDKYEVLGARLNGPVNQTIFSTREDGALNYDVISRIDIERMGATSMEELFRLVPQTSDYGSTALQGAASNPQLASGTTYQNSEVKLRGFSSLQTVILVDGRRLQRGNLSAGPDLNRIPVAAIERIEILSSSASAIYGGGAIGGAINIILRKDYAGRDLTVKAGTSTDGGAETYGFTYFEGRSFNGGRTRYSFTIDYQHNEPLYNSQRNYLDNALARYPANTTATVGGRSVFEQYILQGFNAMPGTILLTAATGTLPIPGVTTARYAAIPAGQDGTALTPASFVASAGTANLGDRYNRSVIYRPEDRYSFNSEMEHIISPDKLTLYAGVDVSYFRSKYSFPQAVQSLALTATDPQNPFRTGVTPGFVGVPVVVYYDPVDIPDPSLFQERQGARLLLGAKGKLGDRWEWSLDGTGEYGRSYSDGQNPTNSLNAFVFSTSASAGMTLAQRRAIYNPLADHQAFPQGDAFAPYSYFSRQFAYYNNLAQANLRVVGDVFDLPAGPLRISPGVEMIWSQYQTKTATRVSQAMIEAVPVVGNGDSFTQQARRTESVFFESVLPLIGPKWRPIPIQSADLNLGVRWEGTDDSTDKTSPIAALRVAPTQDIAFRVSYAEGFFPPDQSNYEGPRSNPVATTPFTDPARGNLNYNYPHEEIAGGNPGLKPETSKAWNYGVVFTPRFAPDLTFSADYWQIEKKNAIVVPNGPSAILASPESYPGRIVRAAPTAADIAAGWLGEVTSVDYRAINVGFTETEGVDFKVRYVHDAGVLGKFTSLTTATWTNSFRDQILPINPIVERADAVGFPLKWRGNSSVFWEHGAWTTGVTATYINSYHAASTTPSPAFTTGNGLDGYKIASATLWDLQTTYRFPGKSSARGWKSWLSDTQWTLSVRNVFNKEPAFRTDIYSYYSRYEDPRQRYVTLQIKKSL